MESESGKGEEEIGVEANESFCYDLLTCETLCAIAANDVVRGEADIGLHYDCQSLLKIVSGRGTGDT